LQDLPGTLDETYDRILLSIDNDHYAEYALRMLKWLAFSSRPLRIHEIAEAVAINVECASFNPDEILEDPLDALKICSGLVSLATPDSLLDDSDHEDDTADSGEDDSRSRQPTIVLAHYSVKEYLVSERIQRNQMKRYSLQEAACHSYIARSCLSYLFQFDDAASFCNETFRTSELAIYSATFWTEHTRAAGKGDEILLQLIMELFLRRKGAFLNSLRIRDSESVWDSDITSTLENIRSPLYWASQAGLTEAVEELVCNAGLDVNPEYGRSSHNALIIASDAGHYDIVELLLSNGADVNAQGGFYGNALQTALDSGSESLIAELLLISNGADVNAQGGGHGDALQAALTSGSENLIAELLLSNDADVNAQGGRHGDALQAALNSGSENLIAELLLSNDADVNMQGGSYGNAHQSALFSGSEKIAELLLSNGADVNAQGSFYGTALQAASRLGSERIAELLLSNGADVNAEGGFYGNALQAASRSGSERIAELLLSNGADVNAQGGSCGNALQAASYSKSERIAELLLSNGADVNAQGGQFGNALQAASYSGSEKIVELLLSNGADVNAQGGQFDDALQAASFSGSEKIAELLLSNGADVYTQGGGHGDALQIALNRGNSKIVKLLVSNGAITPNKLEDLGSSGIVTVTI
jgi:ankyrin repeat protein